jgi:hypothetical protein
VTIRRPLVLAILLYVTLDLSVAWMPGAFVFDAADTIESVRTGGAEEISDSITAPSKPALRLDRPLPEGSVRRAILTPAAPRPVFWPRERGSHDAPVDAASSTDDPH